MTWRKACAFNDEVHRHHRAPRGGKWAIGVVDESGDLHGVALCGRPVSRMLDDGETVEINRAATDGFKNANSALYGACWRIASAMGYRRIVTYSQAGETGASLRAANFRLVRELQPRRGWAASSQKLRHIRDPIGSGGVARSLWELAA
jgi:hypothetical protein